MADGTIINENERTGVLDIEGEIARAAATVTGADNNAPDQDGDKPSGREALAQSIESFTRPGGQNGPAGMAQNNLAAPGKKSIGPFVVVNRTLSPFTLMSPTMNLGRDMKRATPGYRPSGPVPGGSKGKGKHKDHGKVGVVSAYGGGLQEISGAKMPSAMQLKTMMLDPQLLEALQNEKRKMDDPNIVQDADKLNAQDFRNLQQSSEYLDRASDRNATTQRLTKKGPGM